MAQFLDFSSQFESDVPFGSPIVKTLDFRLTLDYQPVIALQNQCPKLHNKIESIKIGGHVKELWLKVGGLEANPMLIFSC